MQGFVDNNREDLDKANPSLRLRNFEEIYRVFDRIRLERQSERCITCGDPFCGAIGCPLGNYIPQWLEAVAEQDLEKAFRLSNETSPFPEFLGRICPHTHLCEGACSLNDGWGAISIGPIEATITDLGFASGLRIPFPGVSRPQKVAVVGSGPAGFSCAHFLLRAGVGVTMFERAPHPGGLLTYGIPNFKLDKNLVRRRFGILKRAGLDLRLETQVGTDVDFAHLLEEYDAVFLGFGATQGRRLGVAAEENHQDVFPAMDFLTAVQRSLFGMKMDLRYDVRGKRVVVVGGGDTAMDCLRTAQRQGAETVTCLYRRDEANMPGSVKEYRNAVEEGVEFCFNKMPTDIKVDDDGQLVGVDVVDTRMGEPDADGRQRVEVLEGTDHCVLADVVIMALGFQVAALPFLKETGIETDKWGQLVIDPETGRTSHEKVFAGGDCFRGADLAVTAAADGRRAALAIMEQLLGD